MRKSTPLSNQPLRMPSQSRVRSSLKGCGAPASAAAAQVIISAAETHVDLIFMFGKPPVLVSNALRTKRSATVAMLCVAVGKELDARTQRAPPSNVHQKIASLRARI